MDHISAVDQDASDGAVTAVACFGATFDCLAVGPEVRHQNTYFASSAHLRLKFLISSMLLTGL